MKNLFILSLLLMTMNVAYAQVPAYVPTNNLIGWYPFNGNANNAATPGSLNGTVNGAILTTDRYGTANSAYWMNGDSANITIDTTFFDIGWSNYSISCWINSDTLNNMHNGNHSQCIINTIPHRGMAIDFNWGYHGNYLLLANSDPTTSSFSWDIMNVWSVAPSTPHVWKHVVMVKSGGTSYSFYLDGVHDTTFATTLSATSYLCKMALGRTDPVASSEGFFGKIDDYGIWDRALTQCEIKSLYTGTVYHYITTQPANVSAFTGATVSFSITDTGTGNTYQWQINGGTGFSNIPTGAPYSGITTPTLTITSVITALSGKKYRCVVNGASCTDTSAFAVLTVQPTGIQNYGANTPISVTPNPTTGDLFITGMTAADIRVYNTLGQLVTSAMHETKISIAELPSGVYFVKLYSEGTLVYTGRALKE